MWPWKAKRTLMVIHLNGQTVHFKKICLKRLTDCSNALHIRSKYISICSKYCNICLNSSDIHSNGFNFCLNSFCIHSPTRNVHSEIRSNGLMSVLFICLKGKIALVVSPVSQYSSWNVTTHIYVTKSWDKWLTQLSF